MKLAIVSVLLLSALVSGAPTSNEDDNFLTVTRDFFPKELQIYAGQHDIVKIVTPINNLNFEEDPISESNEDDDDTIIFFVEADEKDGQIVDQGLYIRKKGNVKKLLDNGRDVTAPIDDSKVAYFAAKDGIYVYNNEKTTAEKYGTVNDDLIGIASFNSSDYLYVLTANKEVYKVTNEGTKKVKVDDVKNAEQMVLDYANNLFYSDAKDVFVVNNDGVKKINLPENHSKLHIQRPPMLLEEGIIVVVDKVVYMAFPNGTLETADIQIKAPITASSVEPALIQYHAYDKKIYRYNILVLLLNEILTDLKDFLKEKEDNIKEVSTRSRSDFIRAIST